MTKQKRLMIAAAGALLLAVSQAQAQLPAGYESSGEDDLLLNFRSLNTTVSPNTTSGLDLTVDLGDINNFTPSTAQEVVIGASLVNGVYGTPTASSAIGFSAVASDDGSGQIWLSGTQTGSPGSTPTVHPTQQSDQSGVVNAADNIGGGSGTPVGNPTYNAMKIAESTSGNSYQAQGEQNNSASGQAVINFGGSETLPTGFTIESVQSGAGNVYEALWSVPQTGGGSEQYLGYFTFQPSGEVDFSGASAVPEPSTYALFGLSGLMGWVFRRQIRSLMA